MHSIDKLVGRLTQFSGLGGEEYLELKSALERHEALFDQLIAKYLMQGKGLESAQQEAKNDLQAAAATCTHTKPESGLALLSHLAACYTVVKCGREFIDAPPAEQSGKLVAPHRSQLLTLF